MITLALERLMWGTALAVFAVLLFAAYERFQGAKNCKAENAEAVTAAVVKNSAVEVSGAVAEAQEETRRERALASPVAPTPKRVQPAAKPARACPVSSPAAVTSENPPSADVRETGAGGGVSLDGDTYIRSVVQHAHDADTEIAYRNRLLIIRDAECRGQQPPAGDE